MFSQNFLNTCIMKSTIPNSSCQCITCPSKSNIMMSHVKRKPSASASARAIKTSTSLYSTCSLEYTQQQRERTSYTSDIFSPYKQWNLFLIGFIILVIACNDLVEGALRNVNLIIEPPAVRRGQHAVLRCMYDLEGAPLYSAKFYRGQWEFYRYTPGEFPNSKVFPFPGIHVDVTNSNATQVLIRNVGFGLSGNFSCEVSADAPLFSTATAIGAMQVVELPDKRPQLFTEHTRYEPGDILRANCSTPPSRPKAELKFTINNMVVNNVETQFIRTIDNLIASRISLKLQLQGIHFSSVNPSVYGHSVYGMNSVHGGGLVLRCTATIGELYQEYKEIELGTPQKDPVPARVTLSSGSTVGNFLSFLSSGSTKLSTIDISKVLLLTGIVYISSIGSLLTQLLTILQLLLIRYKSTLNLKQHSQNVYAYLRLALLSQR